MMDDNELKAISDRLEAMSKRADAVIEKEKLGRPMPILKFHPRLASTEIKRAPEPKPVQEIEPPIVRGRYRPPDYDDTHARLWDRNGREWDTWTSNSSHPSQAERCGCPRRSEPSIMDEIFADFESAFDDMRSR